MKEDVRQVAPASTTSNKEFHFYDSSALNVNNWMWNSHFYDNEYTSTIHFYDLKKALPDIDRVSMSTHWLKITQNVAFEFLNFGIFHQFLSY